MLYTIIGMEQVKIFATLLCWHRPYITILSKVFFELISNERLCCQALSCILANIVQNSYLQRRLGRSNSFCVKARLFFRFWRLVLDLVLSEIFFKLLPCQEAHLSKLVKATFFGNLDVISLLRLLFTVDTLLLSQLFFLFSKLFVEVRS